MGSVAWVGREEAGESRERREEGAVKHGWGERRREQAERGGGEGAIVAGQVERGGEGDSVAGHRERGGREGEENVSLGFVFTYSLEWLAHLCPTWGVRKCSPMLCWGLRPDTKLDNLSVSWYWHSISRSASWWWPAILHRRRQREKERRRRRKNNNWVNKLLKGRTHTCHTRHLGASGSVLCVDTCLTQYKTATTCGSVLCVDTGLTQHKTAATCGSVLCWYLPNSTQAVLPVAQCCVLIPALPNTRLQLPVAQCCADTCLTQYKRCCLWLSVECWYLPTQHKTAAACGSVLCVDTCLPQYKTAATCGSVLCWYLPNSTQAVLSVAQFVCWYLPNSTQAVLSVAQCCVLIPA